MKALVHIGMPKTGSTTLQAFLHANRHRLAGRGVFFRRYRPWSTNQVELLLPALTTLSELLPSPRMRAYLRIEDLDDQRAFSRRYEAWLDECLTASDARTAVFSSEHLYMWMAEPDRVSALDAWLKARFSDVQYLAYVRTQEDYLVSLFSEAVKLGNADSFEAFLQRQGEMDHWHPITVWADAVGDNRIHVIEPARLSRVGASLTGSLCDTLGVDAERLKLPQNRNLSLSQNALAPVIAFNRRLQRLSSVEIANKIGRMAVVPVLQRLHPGDKMRPDPEVMDRLRQLHKVEKQAFRSRFSLTD